MKYFKYGHGKWYPANLRGSLSYRRVLMIKGFKGFIHAMKNLGKIYGVKK